MIWAPVLPQDRSRLVDDEARLVTAGIHSRRTAAALLDVPGPDAEWARWQDEQGQIAGGRCGMTNEPLGLPTGSVRALMSLVVVIGAAVVAAFLTIRDPSSDMTNILVGGWGTALGNVIGFYFGARSTAS